MGAGHLALLNANLRQCFKVSAPHFFEHIRPTHRATMTRKDLHRANLDFPSTFFEDAIEAIEDTQTQTRLREIETKAEFMIALADRVCDRILHAEADKVARLAREKMAAMPPETALKSDAARRTTDLLRTRRRSL
jgi:hypothetical protein